MNELVEFATVRRFGRAALALAVLCGTALGAVVAQAQVTLPDVGADVDGTMQAGATELGGHVGVALGIIAVFLIIGAAVMWMRRSFKSR